jgi:hypothetical protein
MNDIQRTEQPQETHMTKRVLVTGDVAMDANIYHGRRSKPWTPKGPGTHTEKSPGGAFLLHKIIKTALGSEGDEEPAQFEVNLGIPDYLKKIPPETSEKKDSPEKEKVLPKELFGYSLWEPFPQKKKQVWRLSQPLGYGGDHAAGGLFVGMKKPVDESGKPVDDSVDIAVIDDGNLGFRLQTSSSVWPAFVNGEGTKLPSWIVYKMSDPLCEGDLWRSCQRDHGARMIGVVNLEDIRREEVRVTRGVSWERTAQDLVVELERNPILRPLQELRYLVVRIGFEGAVIVRRDGPDRKEFTLVFDAGNMEGDWWSFDRDGGSVGFMSSLTAGLVSRLVTGPNEDAVVEGVKAGLAAMRVLVETGHGDVEAGKEPGFPFKEVTASMVDVEKTSQFGTAPIPISVTVPEGRWSILAGEPECAEARRPLYGPARRLALMGLGALRDVPYQRFGKLDTMDRAEIEALRNLRQLVDDYEKSGKQEKPLSLAVFGPPGSGKSFGIKQIAKEILGKDNKPLEFNLSQFSDPRDLIGALHQVRDKVLSGVTPLVFWDEFDSRGYMWLQYLLAPMQDGNFQEGQITHPIGKCIFVFAGATSWDHENFGPSEDDREAYEKFKLLKGPDFMSRLSGYLNVLGPNPRCALVEVKDEDEDKDKDKKNDRKEWTPQPEDICFPVRRAILLRGMLRLKDDERLIMDQGLLSSFLEITKFKHGARSLEKILEQIKQRGRKGELRRSDLPPAALLELHADFKEFTAIAERDLAFAREAENLAPAIHALYMEHMKGKNLKSELEEEFEGLSADMKADNIAAALRIPKILSLVGLYLVPEGVAEAGSEDEVTDILKEHIELLAEAEHEGWKTYKERNGWKKGSPKDSAKRIHPCIVSYDKLTDEDKGKDRDSIMNIPVHAKRSGYRIVTDVPRP